MFCGCIRPNRDCNIDQPLFPATLNVSATTKCRFPLDSIRKAVPLPRGCERVDTLIIADPNRSIARPISFPPSDPRATILRWLFNWT